MTSYHRCTLTIAFERQNIKFLFIFSIKLFEDKDEKKEKMSDGKYRCVYVCIINKMAMVIFCMKFEMKCGKKNFESKLSILVLLWSMIKIIY